MMCIAKWISATLAVALMASTVAAADRVSGGKVKSINADNKTFVLTDSANKDWSIKLGDKVVVNRAGEESKSDLKVGDVINVCYDKGTFTWTAHYILVQEGKTKSWDLVTGSVKSYSAEKKELIFSHDGGKDSTYAVGTAPVRLNMADSKIEAVKIGDHALVIVEMVGTTPTLRSVMVQRTK
jgi:ribosomal 50S subunit-recycling heat shock protein